MTDGPFREAVSPFHRRLLKQTESVPGEQHAASLAVVTIGRRLRASNAEIRQVLEALGLAVEHD